MFQNIFLGCCIIFCTSLIHIGATRLTLGIIKARRPGRSMIRNLVHIDLVVLNTIIATLIEAALWAIVYQGLGAVSKFEESLYFSIVTFTTLGYGDITLTEDFRLLASFEAANGVIMLGWSTAMVVTTIQNFTTLKTKS